MIRVKSHRRGKSVIRAYTKAMVMGGSTKRVETELKNKYLRGLLGGKRQGNAGLFHARVRKRAVARLKGEGKRMVVIGWGKGRIPLAKYGWV
jgi:hypothetical protein